MLWLGCLAVFNFAAFSARWPLQLVSCPPPPEAYGSIIHTAIPAEAHQGHLTPTSSRLQVWPCTPTREHKGNCGRGEANRKSNQILWVSFQKYTIHGHIWKWHAIRPAVSSLYQYIFGPSAGLKSDSTKLLDAIKV